ncbi:hypothetical protein [Pseudoruegeria sp. HB172150]|uniref:hypothetical protein n=1 Tax=Pseudoruegeria sp. HB172150 TaxID=2721164 RepID=UPI0015568821|nr:hypothetical protein [Pseudoruegeria sp. HB172150]
MIDAKPISFLNTGVPLILLGALAVLIPLLMVPRGTRSQVEVAVGIWASAGMLLLAGLAVFAVIYAVEGIGVWSAFGKAPLATGWFFLTLSGYAAVAWGPVLLLTWLGLAQRVEKRKGEDRAKGGRNGA